MKKKYAYLSKFGLSENDSSMVEIVYNNIKKGKITFFIDYNKVDSIIDTKLIPFYEEDDWLFLVNSIKANNLIFIVKDSMIVSVLVSEQENDFYIIYKSIR